jgi:hypothetical protein
MLLYLKLKTHTWKVKHMIVLLLLMIMSPVGQLGLWAPSSGVQDVFT